MSLQDNKNKYNLLLMNLVRFNKLRAHFTVYTQEVNKIVT